MSSKFSSSGFLLSSLVAIAKTLKLKSSGFQWHVWFQLSRCILNNYTKSLTSIVTKRTHLVSLTALQGMCAFLSASISSMIPTVDSFSCSPLCVFYWFLFSGFLFCYHKFLSLLINSSTFILYLFAHQMFDTNTHTTYSLLKCLNYQFVFMIPSHCI